MKEILVGLATMLFATALHADTLRIGAWNIQNFHHEEGFSLFPWGTSRTSDDYNLLSQYAEQFGRDGRYPDLVALQEIGTREAAERVFPSDQYTIVMSERYAEEGGGDIYTAIAFRPDSGIELVEQEDLNGLIVFDDEGNPTRAGTAILLQYEGTQFWFMSVHLKSACALNQNVDTSTAEACRLLWAQSGPLAAWVEDRIADGVPFIIAGDFNRRFRQLQFEGRFWERINGGDLEEPALVAHPLTTTRNCPTRLGSSRSTQPIDWILLDATVADWFVENSSKLPGMLQIKWTML